MRITEKDLNEGEVICNKCEGGGSWPPKFLDITSPSWVRCPKCHGDGKLDWIYNATGKPKINPYDNIAMPTLRQSYPKLLASELISVQPMDKPETVKIFSLRRSKWQRAVTCLQGLKPLQRLLTIFSKGKEEDGTITSQENTSPPF